MLRMGMQTSTLRITGTADSDAWASRDSRADSHPRDAELELGRRGDFHDAERRNTAFPCGAWERAGSLVTRAWPHYWLAPLSAR
jgi:hypothetical protein